MSKKTHLYNHHLKLKAKIVPFAGWEMPIQYQSLKEEVQSVREKVGMFDVSHMGEFLIQGSDAQKFVDYLISNDFINAEMGKAVYSPLCRENGTVIDDLIAYKLNENDVLVCVNAANIEKDWEWFSGHKNKFNCSLENASDEFSLIALQGPNSSEFLDKVQISWALDLPYYGVKKGAYQNQSIIIARTGYTGEDGFEIFCPHEVAQNLWEKFIDLGVSPCGLGARDVLRLEVGYPLYGHEINDNLTPLEAALKWTVKFDKEDFIGKKALQEKEAKYQLIKLSLEKGIPRQDYQIFDSHNQLIGHVASGTMSPTLGRGIALCHIEKKLKPTDKNYFIKIRDKLYPATYHTKPFVTGGHK